MHLLAGNEEESENVFIEYVSNVIEGESSFFKKQDFKRDGVGHFLRRLFDETERNETGKEVYIPQPTKSCRPDSMHSYWGCPLAYGESKTGGDDTKEGISVTLPSVLPTSLTIFLAIVLQLCFTAAM